VDDENLPDVLHCESARGRADLVHETLAGVAVRGHPDLYELVRRQRAVDLREHRRREPVGADHDDGVETVRAALEDLARGGGERFGHDRGLRAERDSSALMSKAKAGRTWMQRHVADRYVRRARAVGYRSRAAFKLVEIDRSDRLFAPGQRVVDLGAAPGGWSQVAAERIGARGRVVAVDLLEVAPIGGVTVVRGDFRDEATLRALAAALDGAREIERPPDTGRRVPGQGVPGVGVPGVPRPPAGRFRARGVAQARRVAKPLDRNVSARPRTAEKALKTVGFVGFCVRFPWREPGGLGVESAHSGASSAPERCLEGAEL
jgi:23S rRNA U2552 (ribose-2'-O)-methylase RlmE/FtsJ